MLEALSTAPALEILSLKLPGNNDATEPMSWLHHHKRLQSLSVAGIYPTSLPAGLPALTILRIQLAAGDRFNWPAVIGLAYPMLETLEIEDKRSHITRFLMPNIWLSSEMLISWCSTVNLPRLRRVIIHNPSPDMVKIEESVEEVEVDGGSGRTRLVTYLESRGVTCTFGDFCKEEESSDDEGEQ